MSAIFILKYCIFLHMPADSAVTLTDHYSVPEKQMSNMAQLSK